MTLHIARATSTPGEWNAFVRQQASWTHFHLMEWRDVLQRVHGLDTPYLEARDSLGRLAGVLPLVRLRSRVFGHYLVSMPFLNHGGPLGSGEAVRALASHARDMAERERVDVFELRSRVPLAVDLPPSHRKVGVLLKLPGTPDELMKRFDAKLRSQVRRAGKAGATVRFGHDQVEPFHRVYSHHMRDLGTPAQPLALFADSARTFGSDAWFMTVNLDGTPVAGGAGFRWGDEFEITWASALRAYNRVSPNMLLYWSLMEHCITSGVRTFNFGRSTPGAGTHQFKRQWTGAVDETLWWYVWSGSGATAATPSADSGRFSLGPRIWKRLPTSVATALSPGIIRHIP